MGEESKIEWCDHTFNPWIGCTKVSAGCKHCYAETQDKYRSWTPEGWGAGKPRRRTSAANWKKPLAWNKKAEKEGTRPRVFCASLADWLDDEVPIEWLADLLDLIRLTPSLDWLLLTKRPENFKRRIDEADEVLVGRRSDLGGKKQGEWDDFWNETSSMTDAWMCGIAPENVWVGTSVENQEMADKRIPELLEIPGAVKFLSCEPLLGSVRVNCQGIDWAIVGGESGSGARFFNPEWARDLLSDCRLWQSAFFMKQMGGVRKPFKEIPADLMVREFPVRKGAQ